MSRATLRGAIAKARDFLAEADPERVSCDEAAELVELFVELERVGAAGKLLFAARASRSGAVVDAGFVNPAFWLSAITKNSVGDAISALETSKALAELPETTEALKAGGLSSAQAREVSRAARKDPSAERGLLRSAREESLKELQDKARQVLAQSASREDEAARARAIYEKRAVRHYLDHEGAFRLDTRITPEAGARVLSAVQSEADAIFRQARERGVEEPPEAYLADALVALVTGTGKSASGRGRPRRDTVVARIDIEALKRGHVKSGEMCEIAGVGPVPVAVIERLLPDAFVKVVLRDSVDVRSVCHVGRCLSAHEQTALEERDPVCVVPGCSVAKGLENHHYRQDFAASGITSLSELARVCARHHDLITYRGFVLEGGPGRWRFRGPPGTGADREPSLAATA